ncbi:MAG TPA: DUF4345 domain-containing protein [Flavisolibacter sp.]|jgi:hypothetical protein
MKANKLLLRASAAYVVISALSLLSVSAIAFYNPQAVMDLVATKLSNTDAVSSIRGVYGGVGITIVVCLIYTLYRNIQESLALLTIFWGMYAVSRMVTIFTDGELGAFGTQWLAIETVFAFIAFLLWALNRRASRVASVN